MKKVILVIAMIGSISLVGCASNGDVEDLQTQIDVLTMQQTQTAQALISVSKSADDAGVIGIAALRKANQNETKIDRMFEKAMVK